MYNPGDVVTFKNIANPTLKRLAKFSVIDSEKSGNVIMLNLQTHGVYPASDFMDYEPSAKFDAEGTYLYQTYEGKVLRAKYTFDTVADWVIYGPNTTIIPTNKAEEVQIGVFTGSLDSVIKYAVTLKEFWKNNEPGRIVKHVPVELTPIQEVLPVGILRKL